MNTKNQAALPAGRGTLVERRSRHSSPRTRRLLAATAIVAVALPLAAIRPGHEVATFQPPPTYLHLLGRLGHPTDRGYPGAVLYRLPPGCPSGYDPTVGR